MMEVFTKIVRGFQPLIIFTKSSIIDVWQGSQHVPEKFRQMCSKLELMILDQGPLMLFQFLSYQLCTDSICDAMHDLISFLQFKKHERHSWRSITFSKKLVKSYNFTKSNTAPWVFFTFFKLYKMVTKPLKQSHIPNYYIRC